MLRFATPVSVLAAVLLVGCAGGENGDDGATSAFRAALLTGGPVSDAGWYAGAYDGLMMLRDSLGAEVSHQQTRTPAEFDEAFLSYASAGYDVVFAHGFEYQDAAIRAGAQFPNTTFVVSGGGRISDNVVPLIFELEEGSYLAGMMAGGMTQSGIVGMVGGVEIPPVAGTFLAFRAGVHAVNPDAQIFEAFVGNWEDVAGAKEAAVAQIRRGADVVLHNMDGGSFGVFQAVREAVDAGQTVWAIGMNNDQNDVAPEVILGSAVLYIPRAFMEVAQGVQAGSVGGAPIRAGSSGDVVDFVVNPAMADRLPAELLEAIRDARAAIRAGTLEVPRVPFVEDEIGVP